jgi:hypothetical protein
MECLQGVFQLKTAPADVTLWSCQLKTVGQPHLIAGLASALLVDPHLAGENRPLGLFPAWTQASIHQRPIQAVDAGARRDWGCLSHDVTG